jgi:hypothetical protein
VDESIHNDFLRSVCSEPAYLFVKSAVRARNDGNAGQQQKQEQQLDQQRHASRDTNYFKRELKIVSWTFQNIGSRICPDLVDKIIITQGGYFGPQHREQINQWKRELYPDGATILHLRSKVSVKGVSTCDEVQGFDLVNVVNYSFSMEACLSKHMGNEIEWKVVRFTPAL